MSKNKKPNNERDAKNVKGLTSVDATLWATKVEPQKNDAVISERFPKNCFDFMIFSLKFYNQGSLYHKNSKK